MSVFTWAAVLLFAGACLAENEVAIRGDLASIEQYPSLVQIENGVSRLWVQTCVGGILTSRHILSAARCFFGPLSDPRFSRIRAGTSRRMESGVVIYFEKVTNHPSFGSLGFDGDITVVQLTSGLVYGASINAAPIFGQGSVVPANLPVTVAGWGGTAQNAIVANKDIYSVALMTTDHAACAEKYANIQINIPQLNIPEINWPEINWPEINWPEINWPEINWPDVDLPEINWPEINWPEINWPEINWPEINWPEINWPDINLPEINLPEITLPEIPESIKIPVTVTENMFCSGQGTSGASFDPRDGGAPVYFDGVIVGVLSFGAPVTDSFALVATTVSQYTNWIVATAVL